MKQAILFLSDKSSNWIVDHFRKLTEVHCDNTHVYFLYHKRNNHIPNTIQQLNFYTFTDDVLHQMGYAPIENKLIPGSNHFPLLQFYLDYPDYDYYWLIEDDVSFNGSWDYFFNSFREQKSDFISTHVNLYHESPEWYWWNSIVTDYKLAKEKVKSFNPIYRLSNAALKNIDFALKNGWSGHHEVLIPTLLYEKGFKILDMGLKGTFVEKTTKHCFYTFESMSHLPVDLGNEHNLLYHPVKETKEIDLNALKKYCVISAIGINSLHREWLKGNNDFDLHLIIYDSSYNRFYNDTNYICYQNGQKYNLIYNYLQNHSEYLEKYEYFFLPDDDILIDGDNILELFESMKSNSLHIAQPALTNSYFTYEHTLKKKFTKLRYTNFVEMMAPCFSQVAIKQTLFTFNENPSGWGIEFHWPKIIGFTGNEMAVLDHIIAIHTRPVQSYRNQHLFELDNYLHKYQLNSEIIETGYILLDSETYAKGNPFNLDKSSYYKLCMISEKICHSILQNLTSTQNHPLGLTGLTGASLLLNLYSNISEKRKYTDIAFSCTNKICEHIIDMKENLSFNTGLLGFGWYIEFLAQNEFIDNETDEVLEEISDHINNCYFKETGKNITFNNLTSYAQYYLARISNSKFDIKKKNNNTEMSIFLDIIRRINEWSSNITSNSKYNSKVLISTLLILFQSKKVAESPEIDESIEKLSKVLFDTSSNSILLNLMRCFLFADSSEQLNNKCSADDYMNFFKKQKTFSKSSTTGFLSLYLANQLSHLSGNPIFRSFILSIIENLITEFESVKQLFFSGTNENQALEKSNQKSEVLIRSGLILNSILFHRHIPFNNFIFS